MMKIEIFAGKASESKQVGCGSCVKTCGSRDQVSITPNLLMAQIQGTYLNQVEVIVYDFSEGNQEEILKRMNELYRENGIRRIVNKILINPLMDRIWPAVVINNQIKSEGALLDMSQISTYIEIERLEKG